ncbi:MAG TPA: HD domain-containing phosphohydrolase [Candidatus Dormibacteraeota bacterium]|nr:HD domain-containing phosphohydrolase [Candidatus Dormibacteraeota bacterium]
MPAAPALRLGELVATFALAQDNAFGQPLESQLRSCLLAGWMAEEAGFDAELSATVYWVALLRYLGCTGHAHEVAAYLGDEIAARARTLLHDSANPAEVAGDVIALASAARPDEDPAQVARSVMATIHEWAVSNFAAGCEVADLLAQRLGFSDAVRDALACTFERWNGKGVPRGVAGEDIPLAMRVVHVSHDMEAIARLVSPRDALVTLADRRDRTYDPALADLFAARGAEWLERLATLDPWDAVLDLEPSPRRILSGEALDEALVVVADFIDLKSPYLAGFSRRCADLVTTAARQSGVDADGVSLLRRAAWVHDIGLTGVPNTILDKATPLTRAENDRYEVHPLLTEQVLRRTPTLSALNPVAGAHHEHADGTGFHKGLAAHACHPWAGLLAAADGFVSLTTERASGPAMSPPAAAAELRRRAGAGWYEARATEAVLEAAGQGRTRRSRRPSSPSFPGRLSAREVEVLRLAARGLTTGQIAVRLEISAKTADHHIQHVYTKTGVYSRGAAALWAMEHGLVSGAA